MTKPLCIAALLIALIPVTPSFAQGGHGMMGDGPQAADMQLFHQLFEHRAAAGGVQIVETSKDAYVVKLLHMHADVVSAFLTNGMSEMMKNHPVPPR